MDFFIFPRKRGAYEGLYLYYYDDKNKDLYKPSVIDRLREKNAVGILTDYKDARVLLLDCAQFVNRLEEDNKRIEREKLKQKQEERR